MSHNDPPHPDTGKIANLQWFRENPNKGSWASHARGLRLLIQLGDTEVRDAEFVDCCVLWACCALCSSRVLGSSRVLWSFRMLWSWESCPAEAILRPRFAVCRARVHLLPSMWLVCAPNRTLCGWYVHGQRGTAEEPLRGDPSEP
jgi:hypothetical protein